MTWHDVLPWATAAALVVSTVLQVLAARDLERWAEMMRETRENRD